MHSIPRIEGAPGLDVKPRNDGSYRLLWAAPKWAIGYPKRTVRIDYDIRQPLHHHIIREICKACQDEVYRWRTEQEMGDVRAPEPTVDTLVDAFLNKPSSPYQSVKDVTKTLYRYETRLISSVCGKVPLAAIKAEDITRWWKAALGSDNTMRKAQSFIKRLRAIIAFGVVSEIKGAARLHAIIDKMRFKGPQRRRSVLTYDMAVAIIKAAHEVGWPSIALAQAIQFETGLRQTDVIGAWEPCAPEDRSPYRTAKKRWVPGLTWQDINRDMVLTIDTSKTGMTVTHALGSMPLVMKEINRIPPERRIGPMIVFEVTGMPYQPTRFSAEWRKIARAAGVPDDIWNRDSRAGAASESEEAGVEITGVQRMLGHSNAKMTARYLRGKTAGPSAQIANLRQAIRPKGSV